MHRHVEIPRKQFAIMQHDNGELLITDNVPLPQLRPHSLLVKTMAVALNPCDFKMPDRFPCAGLIDGCDFAGIVVALGSDSSKTGRFRIGERVFGAVHGSNPIDPESGAYAEYVRADSELTLKIPDSMTYEEAACIGGTCPATLGLALYWSLDLPGTPDEPTSHPPHVLVWGGSTSIGTMALQILRASGYKPITTCSPKNYDLVKSYGASYVFDYNSKTCAEDIKALTKGELAYVLDPMTEAKTMRACYSCIGRTGGKYTCLEVYQEHLHTRKTVKPQFVMGASIIGLEIALEEGYGSPADPKKRVFGVKWYQTLQRMVDGGTLRPHPIKELPPGFDSILDGLDILRSRTISAQKMVVRICEDDD